MRDVMPDLLLHIAHFSGWHNAGRMQCVCRRWNDALDDVAAFCCPDPGGGNILNVLQCIVTAKHISLQDSTKTPPTKDTERHKQMFFGAALNALSAHAHAAPSSLRIQWNQSFMQADASWLVRSVVQHMEHTNCRLEELDLDLSPLYCPSVDVLQGFVAAVRNLRTLHHLRFMMDSTASAWLVGLLSFAWYGGCLQSFEMALNEHSKPHRQLFGIIDTYLSKEKSPSVLTHLHLELDKFVSNLPTVFRWLSYLDQLLVLRMYLSNVDLGHVCNQVISMEDRNGRSRLRRLTVGCRSTLLTPVALCWMLDGFRKLTWGFASQKQIVSIGAHQTVQTLNLDVANNELTRSVWSNLRRCLGDWTALRRCDMDVSGNICGAPPDDTLSHVDLRHNAVSLTHYKLPVCSALMDEDEATVWM